MLVLLLVVVHPMCVKVLELAAGDLVTRELIKDLLTALLEDPVFSLVAYNERVIGRIV